MTAIKFAGVLIAGLLMGVCARADSVHLSSGISTDETYDDNIHMLASDVIIGPMTNDFSFAGTFAAAKDGPSAYMVTPHSSWTRLGYYAKDAPWWDWDTYFNGDYGDTNPFTFFATAKWVSSDPNGGAGGSYTALYAISFNLPEILSASLHIEYSTDQQLGTTADDGIFLNGIALTGSGGGNYSSALTLDYPDVVAMLHSGENTLYFYNVNQGGPSGVIFDAILDYTPAPVPEPTSGALFGLGVLGIMARRRSVRK